MVPYGISGVNAFFEFQSNVLRFRLELQSCWVIRHSRSIDLINDIAYNNSNHNHKHLI